MEPWYYNSFSKFLREKLGGGEGEAKKLPGIIRRHLPDTSVRCKTSIALLILIFSLNGFFHKHNVKNKINMLWVNSFP